MSEPTFGGVPMTQFLDDCERIASEELLAKTREDLTMPPFLRGMLEETVRLAAFAGVKTAMIELEKKGKVLHDV